MKTDIKKFMLIGLLAAVTVAIILSPFASSSPDGLEKVAEDKGFLDTAVEEPPLTSPIPDYTMPGVESEGLATSLAGLLGTLLTFGVAFGIGHLIGNRKAG